MKPKKQKLWLGTPDPYARLRRIESLDVEKDYHEITLLFYADFMSIMMTQSFGGFMMTFAAPRISRILASTGELEKRFAKRFVDTALLTRAVMEHGMGPGIGRDAARRVNSMHQHYDIHPDDFVMVGCEEIMTPLTLAENYGWRPVTDKERESLRIFQSRKARAFGSPRPVPPTLEGVKEFWSNYLDTELQYEEQNRHLAEAALKWHVALVPAPFRWFFRQVLLATVDTRIVRACGLTVPAKPARWVARLFMKAIGRRDPLADGVPDGLDEIVRSVYPDNDWNIETVGTHVGEAVVASDVKDARA